MKSLMILIVLFGISIFAIAIASTTAYTPTINSAVAANPDLATKQTIGDGKHLVCDDSRCVEHLGIAQDQCSLGGNGNAPQARSECNTETHSECFYRTIRGKRIGYCEVGQGYGSPTCHVENNGPNGNPDCAIHHTYCGKGANRYYCVKGDEVDQDHCDLKDQSTCNNPELTYHICVAMKCIEMHGLGIDKCNVDDQNACSQPKLHNVCNYIDGTCEQRYGTGSDECKLNGNFTKDCIKTTSTTNPETSTTVSQTTTLQQTTTTVLQTTTTIGQVTTTTSNTAN